MAKIILENLPEGTFPLIVNGKASSTRFQLINGQTIGEIYEVRKAYFDGNGDRVLEYYLDKTKPVEMPRDCI